MLFELRKGNPLLMKRSITEGLRLIDPSIKLQELTSAVACVVDYPNSHFQSWDTPAAVTTLMWGSLIQLERGLAHALQ